jgi:hypothetical protein
MHRGNDLSAKYYIRPRKDENPKRWQGPFDAAQLKDLADRRLFSKELHEYSEDRLNWIPARQIWPELFPKAAKPIANPAPPVAYLPAAKPASAVEPKSLANSSEVTVRSDGPVAETQPEHEWYYAVNGKQEGPVSLEQLQKLAARRRIQLTDLVWSPQFGDQWVEARMVAEIFPPIDLSARPAPQSTARTAIVVITTGLIITILIAYAVYRAIRAFM